MLEKTKLYFKLAFLVLSLNTHAYALTQDEAVHLLSRTGFTPNMAEVNNYLPLNQTQAIVQRMQSLSNQSNNPIPESLLAVRVNDLDRKTASREARQAFNKQERQRMQALKEWWFHEMLTTPNPFTENLTLFWHNHFVSSAIKIKRPEWMAKQNQTLRAYSSGNFREFLLAILEDPAMLVYLDNQQNRAGKTNENLARELLELFTLGEGNYGEQDIREIARALSGNGVDAKTGEFAFHAKLHDSSAKTIFGQTGNWNAKDVVALILAKPETAQFITQALWQHFITTPIPPKTLALLSSNFAKDYQLKPLINAILSQPEFWAQENRGTQIKSPVQLTVGLYRQFNSTPDNLTQLTNLSAQMGQNLLFPPNVKGWPNNEDWINSNSLLARQAFIDKATTGMKLPDAVKAQNLSIENWLGLLIAAPLQSRITTDTNNAWQTIENALNDAAYQLQ